MQVAFDSATSPFPPSDGPEDSSAALLYEKEGELQSFWEDRQILVAFRQFLIFHPWYRNIGMMILNFWMFHSAVYIFWWYYIIGYIQPLNFMTWWSVVHHQDCTPPAGGVAALLWAHPFPAPGRIAKGSSWCAAWMSTSWCHGSVGRCGQDVSTEWSIYIIMYIYILYFVIL